MGRTVLYRDPVPYRPARADVQLDSNVLVLLMPDGRVRRHGLDGVASMTMDGFVAQPLARGSSPEIVRGRASEHSTPPRVQRRFVRMLVLEGLGERHVVITPPDQGAVAPNVVSVPEAPTDAAVVDPRAWDSLSEWLLGGGRLSACSIADLARLACIATPQFAVLIGEVAGQRAIEHAWGTSGPWRGGFDLDTALQPLADAARHSPRASDALVSALSHAAGRRDRRRTR